MTTQRKLHAVNRDRADRADRRLILVDIENAAGGPGVAEAEFQYVWHVIRHGAVGVRPGDNVIVAASRFAGRKAVGALAGEPIQWRWRDGADGAELALIDHVDLAHAVRRFRTLVIVSGDHAFAPLARSAREQGMRTHQVIGRGRTSRELWNACTTHARLKLDRRAPRALAG